MPSLGAEQGLGGEVTEGEDHRRLHGVDLGHEERDCTPRPRPARDCGSAPAGTSPRWRCSSRARGRSPPRLEHLGQELAGAADERLGLPVFFLARAFADDHETRARIAGAEGDGRPALAELAERAALQRGAPGRRSAFAASSRGAGSRTSGGGRKRSWAASIPEPQVAMMAERARPGRVAQSASASAGSTAGRRLQACGLGSRARPRPPAAPARGRGWRRPRASLDIIRGARRHRPSGRGASPRCRRPRSRCPGGSRHWRRGGRCSWRRAWRAACARTSSVSAAKPTRKVLLARGDLAEDVGVRRELEGEPLVLLRLDLLAALGCATR